MKIENVALLGAGAVGAYFIWGLSERLGEHFCVVAKNERKERLEKEGLRINGKQYALSVKTPQQVKDVDLLLVASKQDALEEALEDIKAIFGENTIVISLLNGVRSEEIIGNAIGMEHMPEMWHKICLRQYCEYTYHLIKALEEKNDGKFGYRGE